MTDTQTVTDKKAEGETASAKVISWLTVILIGAFAGIIAFGIGYAVGQVGARENPTIDVQMYVMSVDDGADLERYRIEQAGDQFTYPLPEHVMQNIQQSPTFVSCLDGLAISSTWTPFADEASCEGPAIHVVLIAPY